MMIVAAPSTSAPVLSSKRKSAEELISDSLKKQCPEVQPIINNGFPVDNSLMSVDMLTPSSELHGATLPTNGTVGQFEFAAVRPVKRIFVSRLPPDIGDEVLKRHILRRIPSCEGDLNISILQARRNNKYSSALISIGRDENAFNVINSANCWPPETVVHEHRPKKPNGNGFRSNRGNFGRRQF